MDSCASLAVRALRLQLRICQCIDKFQQLVSIFDWACCSTGISAVPKPHPFGPRSNPVDIQAVLVCPETHQKLITSISATEVKPVVEVSLKSLKFGECPANDHRDVLINVRNPGSVLPLDFTVSKVWPPDNCVFSVWHLTKAHEDMPCAQMRCGGDWRDLHGSLRFETLTICWFMVKAMHESACVVCRPLAFASRPTKRGCSLCNPSTL